MEKEVTRIDENGGEITKNISYVLQLLIVQDLWQAWEVWPSGLRRCSKNQKVPGLNPTRHSAGLRDPTLF